MGIRTKIAVYVLGFFTLIMMGFGAFSIIAQRSIYLTEMEHRGKSVLATFALPCAIAIANSQIEVLDNYVELLKESPHKYLDMEYIVVLDYQGRVLAHTDQNQYGRKHDSGFYWETVKSAHPMTRMLHLPEKRIMEISTPIFSGLRWGTLLGGFSLERIERSLVNNIVMNLAFIIGLLILGATFIYLILSKIVLNRIRAISQQTSDIERRILKRGSAEKAIRGDEITNLGHAVERMAERIEVHTKNLKNLVDERTKDLQQAVVKLEALATTDGLTGLFNHRHFKKFMDFEIKRARRTDHVQTLLMIDVDFFKEYNDNNGHVEGDDCLMTLAGIFRDSLRSTDIIARYGGEEFAVLLLDTDKAKGLQVAENVRQRVYEQNFPGGSKQPNGRLTISIGVACFPDDANSAIDLITKSDQAMYRAKKAGKNRVMQ